MRRWAPPSGPIARDFGLPAGSIRLILPNGRKARRDKDVAGLRKDWGE